MSKTNLLFWLFIYLYNQSKSFCWPTWIDYLHKYVCKKRLIMWKKIDVFVLSTEITDTISQFGIWILWFYNNTRMFNTTSFQVKQNTYFICYASDTVYYTSPLCQLCRKRKIYEINASFSSIRCWTKECTILLNTTYELRWKVLAHCLRGTIDSLQHMGAP